MNWFQLEVIALGLLIFGAGAAAALLIEHCCEDRRHKQRSQRNLNNQKEHKHD